MRSKDANQLQLVDPADTSNWLVIPRRSQKPSSKAPPLAVFDSRPVYIGTNVYLRPNYIVALQEWSGGSAIRSIAQRETEANLQDTKTFGQVSAMAMKKIKLAVNWLCQAAMPKTVFDKSKNTYFTYKVGFVTLTVPAEASRLSAHEFNSKLLNPWLTLMRETEGLKHYVWKIETTKAGQLHVHVSIDTFIKWQRIRAAWNTLLKKHGLLDAYRAKYSGITFREYVKLVRRDPSKHPAKYRKAWKAGTECDWTNPNSTDVHSVWKIKNIAGYIAKYMSKENELNTRFRGRIWSCSRGLSAASKQKTHLPAGFEGVHMKPFFAPGVKYSPILREANSLGLQRRIGEVYILPPGFWECDHRSVVVQLFQETISFLREAYSHSPTEFILN